MTPLIAKLVFLAGVVGWYVIRYPFERRSRKTTVVDRVDRRGDMIRLVVSASGMIVIPAIYAVSGFPRFADYAFQPVLAWLGLLTFVASLVLFRLTHQELGRYWSVTLEIREKHPLVTTGVYARVRHPMYTAFFLWAIAQALLLPNWIAGFAGLVCFGSLYLLRVGREERMMLDVFGEDYRAYMARTTRLVPGLF